MFVPRTKQVSLYKLSSVRAISLVRFFVSTESRLVVKEELKLARSVQLICEVKVQRASVNYVFLCMTYLKTLRLSNV